MHTNNAKWMLLIGLIPFVLLNIGCGRHWTGESYQVDSILVWDARDPGIESHGKFKNRAPFMIDPRELTAPSPTTTSKQVNLYRIALHGSDSNSKLSAAQARNIIQDRIIALSDEITAMHLAKVLLTEDQLNTYLGAGDITLDALATVLGSASTKGALAAASGILGSTRNLVNEQIFQSTFGPAILKAIQAERAKALTSINTQQLLPTELYSVDKAIREANAYHNLGSFYKGLEFVQEKANEGIKKTKDDAKKSKDNMKKAIAESVKDSITDSQPEKITPDQQLEVYRKIIEKEEQDAQGGSDQG